MSDFKPCCPSCYGDDFQPLEPPYTKGAIPGWEIFPAASHDCTLCPGLIVAGYMYVKDPGLYRHVRCHIRELKKLLHCNQCGRVFESSQAIELRLLEPVEPIVADTERLINAWNKRDTRLL